MAIPVLAVGATFTAAVENAIANQLNTPTLINTVSSASSATSTGATEVLHSGLLLAVTGIVSGQNYWVKFSGQLNSSVADDLDIISVHALQGTVLISSPTVAENRVQVPSASTGIAGSWENLWTPAASGAWNLQVGVKRSGGSGNATFGVSASLNCRLSLVAA